ncbi:MAG TPA: right-handed parallel beta-helix repeat-containing protein [Stellaceae bacterium]|nr:right-handed parallel beta-helix repeat-containing protein [Stellaceae bacterium]
MNLSCRRRAVLLAPLLLGIPLLRGQNARAQPGAAKPTVFEMAAFTGKTKDADTAFAEALAAIENAVADAKKHGAAIHPVLNLEKNATYRIKRPIEITRFDGLEIDGRGALIINTSTTQTTLHVHSCSHLVIRDLAIDYDPLPFTQGTIAGFDAKALNVTVKVDAGYPDDAKFLATIRDGFFRVMDRRTKALKPGARSFLSPAKIDRLGPGLIRVQLQWSANDLGPGQLPIAVGDTVAISASYQEAVSVEDSIATSFVGLDLRASPGMGILENGGRGGMLLERVNVAPGPRPKGAGADRLISTNADGSHFIAVERGPSFVGCSFANSSDDAVNVHGFYFFVVEKIAPKIYRVSPKWDIGLQAGDDIESCENGSFRSLGRSKVVRLAKKKMSELKGKIAQVWKGKSDTTLPDTIYEIELASELPLKVGDAVTSLTRIGAGTTIRNSRFHACGRVMVKSPDSLIENNQFSYSTGVAIHAGSDIGFWAESNFVRNMTIRNNRFTQCVTGANNLFDDCDALGAIYVGMTPPLNTKGFHANFENRAVVIEGNVIDDSYIYAIFVTNADGVKLIGNKIGNSFIRRSAFGAGKLFGVAPDSGIFIGMTRNAEIHDNTVARGAVVKRPVAIDRTCPKNTVTERNDRLIG